MFQTCFQPTQEKRYKVLTLSSVVTSTRPFHLYKDAMLAKRAGVKKFTFWVLLMALFCTTCNENKQKNLHKCQIHKSAPYGEWSAKKTYPGFQCGQNEIYYRHPVFLYTRAYDLWKEFWQKHQMNNTNCKITVNILIDTLVQNYL